MSFEAYLDIETTGLSWFYGEVTVVGLYLVGQGKERFIQLVGGDVTKENVLRALEDVDTIYTYNGSRFDIPFINATLGLDLRRYFSHKDLMYDCWKCNLHGGLKGVERTLGIPRALPDVNGYLAVILWQKYCRSGDKRALATLLKYNKEDVVNLRVLREKLRV